MQIIFSVEILVIHLAKTLIINAEIYPDEFQAWLQYQTGNLYAKQTLNRTTRLVGLSVIKR